MASQAAKALVDARGEHRQKPRVGLRVVGGLGFNALVRPHEAWLRALALRLTRAPADAQDLVQDTLERALRAWDTFDQSTNVRAWLAAILNNLFIDRCRKGTRAAAAVELEDVAHRVAAVDPDPEPTWATLDERDVRAALAHVQADFAAVFSLHLDGASYQDIAERLGIPRATVGTRLLRARKQLREVLSRRLGADAHG